MALYDVTFGTAATAIAVFSISGVGAVINRHDAGLAAVPVIGAIANGFIVGLALYLAFDLPYWITVLEVAAGECAVLVAGAFIFFGIEKIPVVRRFLRWRWENGPTAPKA